MPDPILYLKASIAALIASAMIVLAFRLILRTSVHSAAAVICALSVGVGVATGFGVLQFSWTWPPINGLNRFLMIVLPATVIVELVAAVIGRVDAVNSGSRTNSAARKHGYLYASGFRLALYASVGRILLHDSVYLGDVGSGNPDAWTIAQTWAVFGGSFAALIAVWRLLCRLSEGSAAGSIPVSLALAIQCTGLATMMAGYIKGGAAACCFSRSRILTERWHRYWRVSICLRRVLLVGQSTETQGTRTSSKNDVGNFFSTVGDFRKQIAFLRHNLLMNDDPQNMPPTTAEQVQMLFVRNEGAIRAFVRALQPSLADADDVLQETFLTVSRKASSFEPGTNFVAWACGIARLKVLENFRQKRQTNVLTEAAINALADEPPTSGLADLREEALSRCVEKLTPKSRELLWRRYSGRQDSDEMADGLGMTSTAVRVALSKARAFLRDCVSFELKNT